MKNCKTSWGVREVDSGIGSKDETDLDRGVFTALPNPEVHMCWVGTDPCESNKSLKEC